MAAPSTLVLFSVIFVMGAVLGLGLKSVVTVKRKYIDYALGD